MTKYNATTIKNIKKNITEAFSAHTDMSKKEIKELVDKLFVVPEKDENKPKKGRSAWVLFSMEKQKSISKDDFPTLGERSREIARMWKKLSAKQKKKYQDMAVKEKAVYEKAMEEYNSKSTTEDEESDEEVAAKPTKGKVKGKPAATKTNKTTEDKEDEEVVAKQTKGARTKAEARALLQGDEEAAPRPSKGKGKPVVTKKTSKPATEDE